MADENPYQNIVAILGGKAVSSASSSSSSSDLSSSMTPYQKFEASLAQQKFQQSELDQQTKMREKQQEFFQKELDRSTQLGLTGTSILNRERDDAARLRFELMKYYGQKQGEELKRYDEQTKEIISAIPKVGDVEKDKAAELTDFLIMAKKLNGLRKTPLTANDLAGFMTVDDPKIRDQYYHGLKPYQYIPLQERLQKLAALPEEGRSKTMQSAADELKALSMLITRGGLKTPQAVAEIIDKRNREAQSLQFNPEVAKRFADDMYYSSKGGDPYLHAINIPPISYSSP